MDYNTLLDMATDLGYELAMSGAETFRVEESISRVLASYGVEAEVFAIPNYLIVTIKAEDGSPVTRMRRIGVHGNDLDAVEKFSGLSRAYCNRTPDPKEGIHWLDKVRSERIAYSAPAEYFGDFIGGSGYAVLFGGNWMDALCGGICGIVVGMVNRLLSTDQTNPFFRTIATSFIMALFAYGFGVMGVSPNPDAAAIGAVMITCTRRLIPELVSP